MPASQRIHRRIDSTSGKQFCKALAIEPASDLNHRMILSLCGSSCRLTPSSAADVVMPDEAGGGVEAGWRAAGQVPAKVHS
jgi:hypothetical protein